VINIQNFFLTKLKKTKLLIQNDFFFQISQGDNEVSLIKFKKKKLENIFCRFVKVTLK
jgi:hypothetical protein